MHKYIDIHTHKAAEDSSDHLCAQSLYDNYARAGNGLPCSVGIHPWYIGALERQLEKVERYVRLPNVLAIGECGLDKVCDTDWQLQMAAFEAQIELANRVGKPLIIHCVRAFDELVQTFEKLPPAVPVIIHGYNKKVAVAEQLLAAGFYLSFGVALLNEHHPAAAVLTRMPDDRFFLETDDADCSIEAIYAAAAGIRKTDADSLILQVQHNFKKVFATI